MNTTNETTPEIVSNGRNYPYFLKSASGNSVYLIRGKHDFVTIRAAATNDCHEYIYSRTTLPESRTTESEFPPGKFPTASQQEFKLMLQKYLNFSDQLKARLNRL